MKKAVLALLVLLVPVFSFGGGPKMEILRLLSVIENAVPDSAASPQNLDEARRHLEIALGLITSSGGTSCGPSKQCIDFAYNKYFASTDSTTAMNRAVQACRKIADIEVAQYLFEKYFASSDSSTAMNRAADGAGPEVAGKLRIIQFAFEKFFANSDSSTAVSRALNIARKVPADSYECLQDSWQRYFANTDSSTAMSEATAACVP